MEIIITKGKNRNTLTCRRADGTFTTENLGPDIPYHDIAHYVVEKKFDLKNGFYGKIKAGMTIAALSDKKIIKRLESESWLAEILARNLQAMASGAAGIDDFIQLVEWEAKNMKNVKVPPMDISDVKVMKSEFDKLCKKWDSISENEQISLQFL